jgi:glucose/arabinose dehydrogenase
MAFIAPGDFFVLEKDTGKVQEVVNGQVRTVLDLAVNNAVERGLLGIALHPNFASNGLVYLYWTESTTGADSENLDDTTLLGNRVDRFHWDGSSLTFDREITKLRALQPANPPAETEAFGNHDGGIIKFGPDGKLYVIIGDVGRRGQTQNLVNGPFGPGQPDDQFGGPQPDDAHMTGVVLRLNDDGTAPSDNPFFAAGAAMGGEVGANVQLIFAYGIRNSFGLAFDPLSGNLWETENGDDSFDELNRITPGMDGGWIQVMGPLERISQFKQIETSDRFFGLQQTRYSPENIADTPQEALARMFVLPGSAYSDPEFSWKYAVPPTAVGFASGSALGSDFAGDMFVGNVRGQLFRFNLTGDRQQLALTGRLADRVDDNARKYFPVESRHLVVGVAFGTITDIEQSPNGSLFVVSTSNGAVYEILRGTGSVLRGAARAAPAVAALAPLPAMPTAVGTFAAPTTGGREVAVRQSPALGPGSAPLVGGLIGSPDRPAAVIVGSAPSRPVHLGDPGEGGPIRVALGRFK